MKLETQNIIRDQWNLWILGGLQAPTGAEVPWKEMKICPPHPPRKIPDYAPGCDYYMINSSKNEQNYKELSIM